jgi:hypothetical protein
LQVLSKVEIAKEATDLFISVIRFSSSFWHIPTRFGYFVAILFITLKAAYLLTGFDEFVANYINT